MGASRLIERYHELKAYLIWSDQDVQHIVAAASVLEPHLSLLIDDFYAEIDRHPNASKVIAGGAAQIERLKGTLLRWLHELFGGIYDAAYIERRWRVGWRHVEIGLDPVYVNVALGRLRLGLCRCLQENWKGEPRRLDMTIQSLNKLLDLDLAIIQDAYRAENIAQLQRAERLATLGQVAGGVAHELRNPLNVVKTSVYYLLNARNPSSEKRAEHLRRIERQIESADNVITALANFAKMPLPKLSPVSVASVVHDVLEMNPPGTSIHVQTDLPDSLPQVLVDVDQIGIVFGNLVRNARDAMSQGGSLGLRGREVDGGVEVDVVDTGIGIPPEDLVRIMEPLYSTKARGLGLGLAIARAILERNQGSLRVISNVGRGSTFTVRLIASLNDGAGT